MTSVFADQTDDLFVTYDAEIQIRDKLMAGTPKDPKLMAGWLRAKAGISDETELLAMMRRTLIELGVEVPADATFEEVVAASEQIAEEHQGCGFKKNGHGIYLEGRQIKAMLKESIHILFAGEKWGTTKKGPKGFAAERVYIEPHDIPLGKEEPDGVDLVIGHVSGPQGKHSTLGYHEYVTGPLAFGFQILSLRDAKGNDAVTPAQWAKIWTHAQFNGLGALRSQGYGTFEVTKWQLANGKAAKS